MAWFTTDDGNKVNTDWFDEDERKKYDQIEKAQQEAKKASEQESPKKESWRDKKPEFQRKTDGGVYFYSSPNSIYGKDIDEKMYDKLPKYIKKAVVQLESRKTGDGNHCEIYYVDKEGKIQWFDEYGMADFMYGLKSGGKDEFGIVSDWEYDGKYQEGRQLNRKGN